MKIFNIRKYFATNSSSSHSILVLKNSDLPEMRAHHNSITESGETGNYGWDNFTLKSAAAKELYLAACVQNAYYNILRADKKYDTEKGYELLDSDSRARTATLFPEFAQEIMEESNSGVDHQSVLLIPSNYEGTDIQEDYVRELRDYLRQDHVLIAGGNDNVEEGDEHYLTHDNLYQPSLVEKLPKEVSNFAARKSYVVDAQGVVDYTQSFWTLFDRTAGTKYRLTFDESIQEINKSAAPELADICITSYCTFGCEFCYQDSTTKGSHAKLEDLELIAKELQKAQVYEVACLEEDTMVLSKNGYVPIKSLSIGSEIYSSEGKLTKIKKIVISQKNCIQLTGNKGFSVISTPDHPFICDGKIIEAQNLIGKDLDQLSHIAYQESQIKELDIAQYQVVGSTHPNSRSGKTVGDKYRHCSSSVFVPTKVKLDTELMFFYGLVVAEGSRKSLALNINEMDLAEKVGKKYTEISGGCCYQIFPNITKNSLIIEFKTPSFYESIFFKAMNCGYGAKNKNLSFLYQLSDLDLVREALYGLFMGDGCFRKKKNQKGDKLYYDFIVCLKTVSKKLALDVVALLKIKFGLVCSFYEGTSPIRMIEGRTLAASTYFSVEINGKTNIEKIFPLLFQSDPDYQKIGTSIYSKNKVKEKIKIKEIKSVGQKTVYDITLEKNSSHVFALSHGVLTHNCGGGEPTLHPDFHKIVKMFHAHNIVVNFTTKNLAFFKKEENRVLLKEVGAFAFSIENAADVLKLKNIIDTYPELKSLATVQYVMGSSSLSEFKEVLEMCGKQQVKATLLGYKENGRGSQFEVHDYSNWLNVVVELQDKYHYSFLSIDTQLAGQSKKQMKTLKIPDYTFHTKEGAHSVYIDAVDMTFAPSSYVGLEQKQSFTNNWLQGYLTMGAEADTAMPKRKIKIK